MRRRPTFEPLVIKEDVQLAEIAKVFGLTESRICQIHAKAVLAIRASLQKLDPCLAA
jgi:DNA-directed RNA polymerase specialized sigma subunit